MIYGLEGIPGSGKGYESAAMQILPALKSGRLVITNMPLVVEAYVAINPAYAELIEFRNQPQPIRGRFDSKALGTERPVFILFEDGHTEDPPEDAFAFGGVWDYYSTWRRADGRGPLFVIDECHNPLPKLGTDKNVVAFYKQHRHFNIDILLQTQSFRDIDQAIAGLLQTLITCRKADLLGKPNSYIRKVKAGYRGGLVSEETRDYDPKYFGLWKSHTQGVALAEESTRDVSPLYVKVQRFKWAVLALAAVLTVWAWWPSSKDKPQRVRVQEQQWYKDAQARAGKPMAPPDEPVISQAKLVQATETAASKLRIGGPGSEAQPSSDDGTVPEPYGLKGLHMVGRLTLPSRGSVYMMVVSQNGVAISHITDADLAQVGYKFRALSDCVATVTWGAVTRTVTCDSPSQALARQSTASSTSSATPQGQPVDVATPADAVSASKGRTPGVVRVVSGNGAGQ